MASRSARVGVLYGLAAYGFWGMFPLYFKAVRHVRPEEVLAHRIVWSAVLLAVLVHWRGRWAAALGAVRDRRVMPTLLASTLLIAINWYTYILAVTHNHVLQASLGYFINPLVNVFLGYVFLGERLRLLQKVSVAMAAAGVLYLTLSFGRFPWIALVLASSFGLYGLLRKTVRVEALAGLAVETVLLAPIAALYMAQLAAESRLAFWHVSTGTDGLLLLAGVVTAIPLLWFTNAARRLRLSTMGFLQYLSPTGNFLLAVLVFSEPFSRDHLVTFTCIWTALAVYTLDTALKSRPEPMHDL